MANIFHGKRVLVTGATGFIGGHVARRLLVRGAQIRVFARDAAKAAPLVTAGAELVVGDLRDARAGAVGAGYAAHFPFRGRLGA